MRPSLVLSTGTLLCLATLVTAQTTAGPTTFSGSNSTQVVNVQQRGNGYGLRATTPATAPGASAIRGDATATGNNSNNYLYTNGVWGTSAASGGVGVRGTATNPNGAASGVVGTTSAYFGYGVYAENTDTTVPLEGAPGAAIYGLSHMPIPAIVGEVSGGQGGGVGVVGTVDGSGYGVAGSAASGTGVSGSVCPNGGCGEIGDIPNAVGVAGNVSSSTGTAGNFTNWVSTGNLLVGNYTDPVTAITHRVFRVSATGTVYADGGYQTSGADFAESFAVRGAKDAYAPGDVLTIDSGAKRRLVRTAEPYSTLVAGIYSTKPGITASPYRAGEQPKGDVPLAVVGVVPCKVTAANGDIRAGDLLVTSSKPGYAMKGTDRSRMVGAVVGKALEPLPAGDGVIQVLVTLQ